MIHLIGIKKYLRLSIRSRMSIPTSNMEQILLRIKSELSDEAVIVNTCNRMEIYINSTHSREYILMKLFNILNWDYEFENYIFYTYDNKAVIHLLEVCCGFHSRILGEDQILGQIREAYLKSVEIKLIKADFHKLFSLALSCGKEFKTKTKLYEVPVSYPSIAVHEAIKNGCKEIAIVGFGKMAQLAFNYFVTHDFHTIYIVVRDINKVKNSSYFNGYNSLIQNGKIIFVDIKNQEIIYSKVQTIICCTSSPTPIILKEMLCSNSLLIFDLSIPSNVHPECERLSNIKLYNLDNLHNIDVENKLLRKKVMTEHKEILEKYFIEYKNYLWLKSTMPIIKAIKKAEMDNTENHLKTFKNKKNTKDNDTLVKVLLNSTSNTYVNKAIEILKEESLNGNIDKTYDIIKRIFIDSINMEDKHEQ